MQFESPRHARLSLTRPDGEQISFVDGRYRAKDDADIELLRGALALEHGVVEAVADAAVIVPTKSASPIDLGAFPFERRTYQRGNEPFVVAHLSPSLAGVADGARGIAAAFAAAFAEDPRFSGATAPQLQFITAGGRCEVPSGIIVERELTATFRLECYRKAHVVVRTSGERGDAFELEAIAAGTPTVVLNGDGPAVDTLAAVLREAEASYVKRSAEAAKAAKQIRSATSTRG